MAKLNLTLDEDYKNLLSSIKHKVRNSQLKAAVAVNRELLKFYWELGQSILGKQEKASWGDGFLTQLSTDLMSEFPEMKGFSKRNLELIRKWHVFWQDSLIAKQAVSQLQKQDSAKLEEIFSIPWGHNIVIMSKAKSVKEASFYVRYTIKHNWSRSVLTHQIESGLYKREGKAIENFSLTLPTAQSDLAQQTLKDPYVFDFLSLTHDYNERDLQKQLIQNLSHFLLELGAGFAYIGQQMNIAVGGKDFFIDLLFYHTRLHCYVVIELKTTDFEPEHAGKLNFYIKAVDTKYRKEGDQPTIGIIICKNKNKVVAEYALSDIKKPIGVSEYQLTRALPKKLKPSLPSIEDLERELTN